MTNLTETLPGRPLTKLRCEDKQEG